MESKTYVFGNEGSTSNNGMLGLLAPLLQKQGVDPNVLLAMKGMVSYLRYNGYHFSKKMCEWAVKQMYKYDPSSKRDVSVSFWDKEKVDSLLLGQGIEVKNKVGYDHVYVANMARADFYKSSIKDEEQLAQFIKDMVDDADQKDGFIFNRFYADCCHNGVPIPWEDVL